MVQTLQLEYGDMIQIKTTSLEPAKMVKLQPQSVKFLDISDPKAVLERAFRNFATLTKGDVFNFEYNDDTFDVAVLEVKPETDKMGVCMIETDVSVEFAPPVGYVEPPKGSGTSTPRSTRPGLPVGGLLHNHGTMAQAINYDAIAPQSSAASTTSSHFLSEGYKLNPKKKAKINPTEPSTVTPPPPPPTVRLPRGNRTGPMPLRLPPNKLFFGYEVKPVKTNKDGEDDEASESPHFAGQGQTLRGVVKRKEEGDTKSKSPSDDKASGEGRRLDGRKK